MLEKILQGIAWAGNSLQSLFLLLIRLYFGYQFMVTGLSKFLSLGETTQYFSSLNISVPFLSVIVVAIFEFVGGLLLFLGFRLGAVPLIIVMIGALMTASHDSLSSLFKDFNFVPLLKENAFIYLWAALTIFIFGPGRMSADYWLTGAYHTRKMP